MRCLGEFRTIDTFWTICSTEPVHPTASLVYVPVPFEGVNSEGFRESFGQHVVLGTQATSD